MGRVPQLAWTLVERLALNPSLTIGDAKDSLIREINASRDYSKDWERCSALERLLLVAIAANSGELYGVTMREQLAAALGVPELAVPAVQSALRALARRALVFKPDSGNRYEVEDPMFREWLLAEQI